MAKKVVLFQKPNAPILTALGAYIVARLTSYVSWLSWLSILAYGMAIAALGYWAYLEITEGVNAFRRLLGWFGMLTAIYMAIHYVFY